jgi:hypothetical protein
MAIDFQKVSTERPPLGDWNEVLMEKEGSILTSKYCMSRGPQVADENSIPPFKVDILWVWAPRRY